MILSDEDRQGSMATILVMDDEAPIRTWASMVLQSAGYALLEASIGCEGLRLSRQTPADLVIVDILMPELNGLDTIMELPREFLNLKVLAISGLAADHNMPKSARLLGARRTLCKPLGLRKC